jgi:Alginate lyase
MFVLPGLDVCAVLFSLLFSTGIAGFSQTVATGSASPQAQPRVFLYNARVLASIRAADSSDPRRQKVIRAAIAAADRAMAEGPFSVMQKAVTPPSGDKHDYMSQAPYWWADPSKPNGLPYIRRDGERNPELKKISDHDQFLRMSDDARTLALAFYLTGNPAYANRAALLLRTWFLDPATRMNPNLEFGQGIPGINTGRGIGIIESRGLTAVTDAVGLLAGAKSWTTADQDGMKTWLTRYLNWMRTSDKGKAEDAAKNNHGTWYDLQVTDIALFLGDRSLAVDTLNRVKTKRIAVQIEPDGRQPLELVRTNAWSYSNGNLDGLVRLATLGNEVGVDLWNFRTPEGRSIRAAVDFLLPYATGAKKWNYKQISGFHGDSLQHTLERAATAYHDPKYAAAAQQVGSGKEDLETLLLRYE